MSRTQILAVALTLVGSVGAIVAIYWLYKIRQGIIPTRFSETAKRLSWRSQRILAWCDLAGNILVLAFGLAMLMVPALNHAVARLLGE